MPKLSVRLDDDLSRQFKVFAAQEGKTQQAIAEMLIRGYLNGHVVVMPGRVPKSPDLSDFKAHVRRWRK